MYKALPPPPSFALEPTFWSPSDAGIAYEAKHAALTYAELEQIPDEARAFEQLGKAFLLRPVPELKKKLEEEAEAGSKDAAALEEKKKHVAETYKKIQEDFQEFVKAHVVTPEEAAEKEKNK